MLKKLVILGSVLLTLGMSALFSVYGLRDTFSFKPLLHLLGQGNRLDFMSPTKSQLSQPDLSDPNLVGTLSQRSEEEQHRLLQANMQLLMVNAPEDSQLAEALYGENWQQEVEAFKKKLARKETMATWSTVVTIIALFTLLMTGVTGVAHALLQQIKQHTSDVGDEEDEDDEPEANDAPKTQGAEESASQPEKPKQRDRLIPPEQSDESIAPRPKVEVAQTPYRSQGSGSETPTFRRKYPSLDYGFATQNFDEQHVEHLLSDESSVPPEKRLQQQISLKRPSDAANSGTQENQSDLQSQTAALAAQVAQLTEQTHEKQSNEDAEPVNEALKNLSDQISAIRTFAATQQDRVEKLQSGYDWNIIRTFCLRIIRCIDNLENRIAKQEEEGQVIDHLTDVRDELLFALESSGVEQYDLDIESSFRGQERRAEAVKEKEPSPSEELKGCIAEVVNPGYQYVIDEDNMRVVRMARVKLYD